MSESVCLVGAGPGDPGLLTLRGLTCLREAEVIYYDYLVSQEVLRLASPWAKKVYAGKRQSHHTVEQEEIVRRMVRDWARGKKVVRLKGGDPFLFGRGGEEAEALARRGIPFEVVPGVSAAIAVPAYAGIPVTHRDYGSNVVFLTGHEKRQVGKKSHGLLPLFDWKALARMHTLSILMGVNNLPEIVRNLLAGGKDPATPVAIVEWGTLPIQRTIEGTLGTIVTRAKKEKLRPPAVIVVGKIASLRSRLKWFEKKPLFGKKILVTRSQGQAASLASLLQNQGALVYEIPTIEIVPPKSWRPLDCALRRLKKYDGLLFSSVNGVEVFWQRLLLKKTEGRALAHLEVFVVGPATAQKLSEHGIRASALPEEYRAEGMARLLSQVAGKRFLFPRAEEGRDLLVKVLRRRGALVDLVPVYRTKLPKEGRERLRHLLRREKIDLVTFSSSSAVRNFVKMGGRKRRVPAACIGPVTAKTARELGFKVVVVPKKSTIPELAKAIVKQLQ